MLLFYLNHVHVATEQEVCYGYVLAGDNLDRNTRPRHQTLESRTHSMHWFNAVAVKDRIDISTLPDVIPTCTTSESIEPFLLNSADCTQIINNISVLVGRLLVEHVPGFAVSALVKPHIDHRYSVQMATKSQTVNVVIIN